MKLTTSCSRINCSVYANHLFPKYLNHVNSKINLMVAVKGKYKYEKEASLSVQQKLPEKGEGVHFIKAFGPTYESC